VLNQLGQVREVRECLREAEGLAERLNDDRRRGQVCANLTNVQGLLGQLDEAVVAGNRALEIARRLADLRLRIAGRVPANRRAGDREPRGIAARLDPRGLRPRRGGLGR
jgi:hypothetical protein